MTVTVKSVLAAFNASETKQVKYDDGAAMAALADNKSAYGRALRDVTVVALSGRWRDAKGIIVSDNQIEDRMGVPVRHPRFRLRALALSGLVFKTNTDITDNADVWAHVARMYNAGKAGRDLITATAETVKDLNDMGDKRTAWLNVAVPKRVVVPRAAQPNDGTSKSTKEVPEVLPVPEVRVEDEESGELIVPENVPLVDVKSASTAELLSLFHSIGDALLGRNLDSAERVTFRENVLLFSQATKPKTPAKATVGKPKVKVTETGAPGSKAPAKAGVITGLKMDDALPAKAPGVKVLGIKVEAGKTLVTTK